MTIVRRTTLRILSFLVVSPVVLPVSFLFLAVILSLIFGNDRFLFFFILYKQVMDEKQAGSADYQYLTVNITPGI